MKHFRNAFNVLAIAVCIIGLTTNVEVHAAESIWEIATSIYHDDLQTISDWSISDNAKTIISKIYEYEYKITHGLFEIGNSAVEYLTTRFKDDAITMDIYSSLYLDYKDDVIVSVQTEDDSIANAEIVDGNSRIKVTGLASGQTTLYVSSYDKTIPIDVTIKKISRSTETYNVKVGETRKLDISALSDIAIDGYKLSKKTVVKDFKFNAENQTIEFTGRKAGNVKIYLTSPLGKTLRLTVKVVGNE